jgi:hypothetical protein
MLSLRRVLQMLRNEMNDPVELIMVIMDPRQNFVENLIFRFQHIAPEIVVKI